MKKKTLTKKQAEIFEYIKEYIQETTTSPTLREISNHFEISRNAALDHIKYIEKKGYIKRDPHKMRNIQVIIFGD